MTNVDPHTAGLRVNLSDPMLCAACDQSIKRLTNRLTYEFRGAVSRNGMSSVIPKRDSPFEIGQGNAFRQTVECGFQQFCSIGHSSSPYLYIGMFAGQLDSVRARKRIGSYSCVYRQGLRAFCSRIRIEKDHRKSSV